MGRRKTQEQFEQDVSQRLGEKYIVLSEYPGAHGKVHMKHLECGREFDKNVHDIISKSSGCPYCNGNKKVLYTEQWVKENTPLPYQYLSGFVNMTTKCNFYCNNCRKTFQQMPARLINQKIYGCYCGTKAKTHDDFLNELGEETLSHYSINTEYINTDTKVNFTHKDCGAVFDLEPDKFLHRYHKQYCPICFYKKSKGEILIAQTLQSLGISYIKEYSFKELPKLRYDFFLPDLNSCIEFDGKQHFIQSDFFNEPLEKLQNRDIIKNQFCLTNNITLYRIPYTDIEDISTIIYNILKEKRSETIEKYQVY